MKFDNVSFSKEGYAKFTQLTKEKQIEKLSNLLNPKDEKRAEKLLTHIPNGDISAGNDNETSEDKGTGSSEADGQLRDSGQKPQKGKNKRA